MCVLVLLTKGSDVNHVLKNMKDQKKQSNKKKSETQIYVLEVYPRKEN